MAIMAMIAIMAMAIMAVAIMASSSGKITPIIGQEYTFVAMIAI